MIPKDFTVHESCIDGRMTKRTFIFKGHRAKEYLELVHTNVYGTFGVYTWRGYGYFIFFINEYSGFGYEYLVHSKSDALDKFIEYKAKSGNLLAKLIKAFLLDRGDVPSRFEYFYKEYRIIF